MSLYKETLLPTAANMSFTQVQGLDVLMLEILTFYNLKRSHARMNLAIGLKRAQAE